MGVPKKRHTKSKTRSKRSHHSLSRVHTGKCKNCSAPVMPHEACRECGAYRGKTEKVAVKQPDKQATK